MPQIEWSIFKDAHVDQDALILGKGPTFTHAADFIKDFDGPILCINETCLHVPIDKPNVYAISLNEETWVNIAAGIKHPEIWYIMPEKIYRRYRPYKLLDDWIVPFHKCEDDLSLLSMDKDDVAWRRRLYTHRSTVTAAVHFAWILGVQNINFIGFGGDNYSSEFTQTPQPQSVYTETWQAALRLCDTFRIGVIDVALDDVPTVEKTKDSAPDAGEGISVQHIPGGIPPTDIR